MRIWVDLTNSPHVLVMRPLIEAMRADGHEVQVTARDFAQTLQLCERFAIAHTAIGRHRGGRLSSKGLGLAHRSGALARWARPRRFEPQAIQILRNGNPVGTVTARGYFLTRVRGSSAGTWQLRWSAGGQTFESRTTRALADPRTQRRGSRGPERTASGR